MTGLLIKDFRLLKVQKNFFTLIVFILLGMILFSEDNFFAVSFATFIFSLFSTSTVSYDEFDNGNPFLFSLPVTRKGYVLEKYCFGLILGGSAWFVSTLLVVIVQLTKGAASLTDLLLPSLALLPFMLFLLAVMLPIQLKFGSEKGRIVLIGVIGLIFLLGVLAVKAAEALHIDLAFFFQQPVIPAYERADFWRDCCHAAPFAAFTENQYGCHEPKRVLTKSCGTTDLLSVPQLFSAIRTKPPADVSVRNLFRYFCNSSAS